MKNITFLQNYQHLQYGIMYNKLIDLSFASIAWCKTYDSAFFNHAQINSNINSSQIEKIEKELSSLDRKKAIYFENSLAFEQTKSLLESNGYKKLWEDSWMFHNGANINLPDHKVVEVKNENQLEEFLDTFDKCYQKDDPQNPYGELGDYLKVAKEAWLQHKDSKLQYFTVFLENEPVGVSSLTSFAGIGYISNVGSLQSVRGKGCGKAASLYAVKQSVNNGNQYHTLATEEGDYPNEFYIRIGFETKFTGIGYTKE